METYFPQKRRAAMGRRKVRRMTKQLRRINRKLSEALQAWR